MLKNVIKIFAVVMLMISFSAVYAEGNVEAGKNKAGTCATCHGAKGEGSGSAPKLAGLDEQHIVKQLTDFKSGARKSQMMNMFAQSLDHMDIANLAAYYASLK